MTERILTIFFHSYAAYHGCSPGKVAEDISDLNMVLAYERALKIIRKTDIEFNFNRLGSFNVSGTTASKEMYGYFFRI